MTKNGLHVAPGVTWPIDAVTETFWWCGKRGSGKTHDCSVFVEELLRVGAQVVVIDPMRAWWGLRSSVDGRSAGFPIPIFGGPRGDAPLEDLRSSLEQAALTAASAVPAFANWMETVQAAVDRATGAVAPTPVPAPPPPRPGEELLEYWRGQIGNGKPRDIFEELLAVYPDELTAPVLAERLGIDPGVSTLRNGISTLRSLGVVEGNRVSPALMEAVTG